MSPAEILIGIDQQKDEGEETNGNLVSSGLAQLSFQMLSLPSIPSFLNKSS